jgi:hypothetical protein
VNDVVPPLCLLLALAMFIAAFAVMATGRPEPSVELHRARAGTDEQYRWLLEDHLRRQQREHTALVAALLGGGALLVVAAFLVMRGPRRP